MNIDHRSQRLRRGFAFLALAAVLGLSAVGLTQCRMIDDSVTGVDLKTNGSFAAGLSQCIQQCNDKYKACQGQETERHRNALRKIESVRNSTDREAAKKLENRRHEEVVSSCEDAMQRCKKDCKYREGSGAGGR